MSAFGSTDPLASSPADAARHALVGRIFASRVKRAIGSHSLLVLEAPTEDVGSAVMRLRPIIHGHYVSAEINKKRLAELGATKTAAILAEHLPRSKQSRSGDLGEVLATEVTESRLGYKVPVRRLRWKDGRDMALRGDDLIGLSRADTGSLRILKGESKSRAAFASSVLDEAAAALDRYRGRPSRHSVLFVAERLREMGQDSLAVELEEAVLQSFSGYSVEHLVFAVTGTDATNILTEHLVRCSRKRRKRHAVAVRIRDHGRFIRQLYEAL